MTELRRDPLRGFMVVIAPERARRPNEFRRRAPREALALPPHDPDCPFCEGNERETPPEVLALRAADSLPNGTGWRLRVVPNRYPAFRERPAEPPPEGGPAPHVDPPRFSSGLHPSLPARGAHEVLVESPAHDLDLPHQTPEHRACVVRALQARLRDLAASGAPVLALFKNHGAAAGASLAHPHVQLATFPVLPPGTADALQAFRQHRDEGGGCLLCALVREELALGTRVVDASGEVLVLAPWAPRFPWELLLLPRVHEASWETSPEELAVAFGETLASSLKRLARLLGPFAYNLVVHTAPRLAGAEPAWHWHAQLIPRVSGVAGLEWGSGVFANSVSPEAAAAAQREA